MDREALTVTAWRLAILVFLIVVWQWGWDYKEGPLGWLVPNLLDPYFVSQPSRQRWMQTISAASCARPMASLRRAHG